MKRWRIGLLVTVALVLLAGYVYMVGRPVDSTVSSARNEAWFPVNAIELCANRAVDHGADLSVDTIPELLDYYDSHPDLEMDENRRRMLEGDGKFYAEGDYDWEYSQEAGHTSVGVVYVRGRNPKIGTPSWKVAFDEDEQSWERTDQRD